LAALEPSHELLPAAKRALLRRLPVFSGAFTTGVAQQLASGPKLDAWAWMRAGRIGAQTMRSVVACLDSTTKASERLVAQLL
jgi:predicted ATPase